MFGSAWPHACPNGWETTQQDRASGVNRQRKPLSTCLCTGQETWGAEGVDSGKTSAAAPSSGDGAALRGTEHSVSLVLCAWGGNGHLCGIEKVISGFPAPSRLNATVFGGIFWRCFSAGHFTHSSFINKTKLAMIFGRFLPLGI